MLYIYVTHVTHFFAKGIFLQILLLILNSL